MVSNRRALVISVWCIVCIVSMVRGSELFTLADFDDWDTEQNANGACWAEIAPAPNAPGLLSIKVTYRIFNKDVTDWIDFAFNPIPPRDVSEHDVLYVDVYPLQDADYLTLKLVDPDVTTNINHSAFESPLSPITGGPLRANQWNRCPVRLPSRKEFKDSLTHINFYISCRSRVPANEDVVFYIGKFKPSQVAKQSAKPVSLHLVASVDFEKDATKGWLARAGATLTRKSAEVVSGRVSLKCDSTASDRQWNEFLHTDPMVIKFEAGKRYIILFDYKVLANGNYYCLLRSTAGIEFDCGWLRWNEPEGSRGTKMISCTIPEKPNYYLIIGIHGAGALAVDNVRIFELD